MSICGLPGAALANASPRSWIGSQYAGHLKVVKVDVDANRALAVRYEAQSIPLLLVMQGGSVTERVVGARPYPALKQIVERHLLPT